MTCGKHSVYGVIGEAWKNIATVFCFSWGCDVCSQEFSTALAM